MKEITVEEWRTAQELHVAWLKDHNVGQRMVLEGVDLGGIGPRHLEGANFRNAVLEGCRLVSCRLEGGNFAGVSASNCNLEGLITYNHDFNGAKFSQCSMRHGAYYGANFFSTQFDYCNLEGCKFQGANFENVELQCSSFVRANLEGANLILGGTDVRGYLFHAYKSVWNPNTGEYHVVIRAGCQQHIGFKAAEKHWGNKHYKEGRSTELYQDCLSLVRRMKTMAKAKGWIE